MMPVLCLCASAQFIPLSGDQTPHQTFVIELRDKQQVELALVLFRGCDSEKLCFAFLAGQVIGPTDDEIAYGLLTRFDIGALCAKKPRQWSVEIYADIDTNRNTDWRYFDLDGPRSCTVELASATLVYLEDAERETVLDREPPRVNLIPKLKAIQLKRDTEAYRIEKAYSDRVAAAALERKKMRDSCASLYRATIDKKLGDLTVREQESIRDCRAMGMYSPAH
jgi:hypothetical protein